MVKWWLYEIISYTLSSLPQDTVYQSIVVERLCTIKLEHCSHPRQNTLASLGEEAWVCVHDQQLAPWFRKHLGCHGSANISDESSMYLRFIHFFSQYVIAKDFLIPEDPARRSKIPEPMLQIIAGGLAGCATWMPPVYTLDVIKTRIQTAAPGTYSGMWDCTIKTWRYIHNICCYLALPVRTVTDVGVPQEQYTYVFIKL